MSAPGYHLWLKPPEPAHALFAATIDTLARRLSAARFEPHITLLARLEGGEADHIRRSDALAEILRPFEVQLSAPAYGNQHFQCIYMLVRQSGDVIRANALARRLFERGEESFMPHLSLVYGTYPNAMKKQIVDALPESLRASFIVGALHLVKSHSDDPRDWHEIHAAPLRG